MPMPMPAAGEFTPADGQPGAGRLGRLRAQARHAPAVARQHWLFTLLLARAWLAIRGREFARGGHRHWHEGYPGTMDASVRAVTAFRRER